VPSSLHPAARAFDAVAEVYERARPSFPPDAVAHLTATLALGPGRVLLDLGAGTGKLTRLLVPTGARVVAVEPLAEMRATLVQLSPSVEALEGTAEDIPLSDASADAVTVAQAFHWFRGDEALAEIHRVLRPGGSLVLLEHVRGAGRAARWQDRLTPFHRRVMGNCHLNRDTFAAVEAAGFETSGVVRAELPGEPALYRAGILGVATRISS
jgi:ubiquinone/menaquinone biosynthesis C-methylase UbiE